MTGAAGGLVLAAGAVVFAVGAGIRLALGSRTAVRARHDPRGRAMEILNERYVRGEIDRDEYLERRAFIE